MKSAAEIALAAVGVNLSAVRARIRASFGPDVLAKPSRPSRRSPTAHPA